MTAPSTYGEPTPPAAADPAAVARSLTRWLPGTVIWFGTHTRRWWAMVWMAGRWRLIDAAGPEELTQMILRGPS